MNKTLVILAAGIGTRYGRRIKQLEAVDNQGHLIIDYSIHDAIAAGFNRIIFIIRHAIEEDFKEKIGNRIEKICKPLGVEVLYAFQELDKVPVPVSIERIKPWGTGHAVVCCEDLIHEPFAVINADDYYGKNGFRAAASFLGNGYGLVGYVLKNTLSDHGGVTRGICNVSNGKLTGISETKNIVKTAEGASVNGIPLDVDSLVSMNFWCYPAEFMVVLKKGFPEFLATTSDIQKDEYLLPNIADQMLKNGTEFTVLPTDDHWFGVTYKEDKPAVMESIQRIIELGEYQVDLYSDL